ncbi:MAG TPA: SOS response-associated peptidase [Mycobacteriales bacterium]|nr:SOS response-associated peptidase [Mycobacteriales bacterium]
MCGRYASTHSADDLAIEFDAEMVVGDDAPPPDYNVAPTKPVYVVVQRPEHRREVRVVRWGLVPPWADSPAVGSRMLNARSETLLTSRAFAPAAAARRCLVPASGWYEWTTTDDGRQPYYITPRDGRPLAFAGLYEFWRGNGTVLISCTIVTTEAREELESVHSRMPVVLRPEQRRAWLDPAREDPSELLAGDVPDLELRPVGPAVGNVANNGPALQERYEPLAQRLF